MEWLGRETMGKKAKGNGKKTTEVVIDHGRQEVKPKRAEVRV